MVAKCELHFVKAIINLHGIVVNSARRHDSSLGYAGHDTSLGYAELLPIKLSEISFVKKKNK